MNWRIEGGTVKEGSVSIAGYKHALVPMLTASMMFEGPVEIRNVPSVLDTVLLCEILEHLGARVERGAGTVRIDSSRMVYAPIPGELSGRIHGAVYLLPTLLARFGRLEMGESGGCQIGSVAEGGQRPVKHMVEVLERFGARFETDGSRLSARCERLKATHIDIMDFSKDPNRKALEGPYHSGATKTALMAAVAAEGTTVIDNPHDKEATLDLAAFLAQGGADIEIGDRRIVVRGGEPLKTVSHSLISDTTEMVTFICLSVFMNRSLRLTNITVDTVRRPLGPELAIFEAMGIRIEWGPDWIQVIPPQVLRGVDVEATGLGVATDSQPFFTLMLTLADRPSRVSDAIWGNRFAYVEMLVKLGAQLRVEGATVHVTPGRPSTAGQQLRASDTRAAAVLAVAALGIPGTTSIADVHHHERGYEQFVPKLRSLGAKIEEREA